jgi:plastocyanin
MSAARLSLAAVVAAGACAVLAGPAAASSGPSLTMLDDCDPVTFAVVPGGCARNGKTTLGELLAAAASPAKSHPDWVFKPGARTIGAGQALDVRNHGGEVHSFTEVTRSGFQPTGCAPPINFALVGSLEPNPLCLVAGFFAPTLFAAGDRRAVGPLDPGTHLFQCLIHPWMRTTVRVKAD